jgi:hypothetical protein
MLGFVRRIRGVFAMIKIVQGVLLGSTLFLASAPAQATVTLASLIADGGTITDGDKVFSDFSYTPSGDAPPAADIAVIPFTNGAGEYGIQFSNSFTAAGTDFGDAALSYVVTVNNSHWRIDDATAFSVGTAINGGFWDVSETLFAGTSAIGTLTTFDGIGSQFSDHTTFDPVSSILVIKDISFHGNGGLADLSVLDQNFSQTAVPEPSTWAMMLLGFVGLGYAAFRRNMRPRVFVDAI